MSHAGDITASTAFEQIVAVGMMIVGVLFFGWLISSISDLMDVRSYPANHLAKAAPRFCSLCTVQSQSQQDQELICTS